MGKRVKLGEAQLKKIISNSVKKAIMNERWTGADDFAFSYYRAKERRDKASKEIFLNWVHSQEPGSRELKEIGWPSENWEGNVHLDPCTGDEEVIQGIPFVWRWTEKGRRPGWIVRRKLSDEEYESEMKKYRVERWETIFYNDPFENINTEAEVMRPDDVEALRALYGGNEEETEENGIMENKVRLSESQLKKLIAESVKRYLVNEVDDETYKKSKKVMPWKYMEIFKNRVLNASHGSHGEVKRTIVEFFKDFKDKIPNEGFTIENLMDLADKFQYGSHDHITPGAKEGWNGFFAQDELGGDNDAFGPRRFDESKKHVKLSESQLKQVIAESVKKVLNEISSDMIGRAKSRFHQKYGGTDFPGPDAKDFPKDEHGNLLYPKDMKPLADHYRKFNQAYDKAKREEEMNDPLIHEAMEIWNEYESDVDWDVTDDFDNEGVEVGGYLEVDGWKFGASAYGHYAGGLEIDEVYEVEFESPDGEKGSFRP